MIPLINISLFKSLKPSINHIAFIANPGHLFTLFIIFLVTSPAASQAPPAPQPNYTDNFKHGLGLIVFVLTVFIFFMSFFSIYLRHCSDERSGTRLSAAITGRSRRGNRGGLDPAVLGTFPVFNYSAVKEMKIAKGALECAVCINEFEDDQTLRLIPKCDHVFHSECIDMWLDSHATCPVCRANLALLPGDSLDPPVMGQTAQPHNETETGGRNDDVAIEVARQQGESTEQPLNARPRRSLIRSRTRVNASGRKRWFGLFLRSHSTGHVAVNQLENMDRFTLRLPEEIRRQIISGKLSRTTSCLAPSTAESNYGVGDGVGFGGSHKEGSSQTKFGSDRFDRANRCGFALTPQLFSTAPKMARPDSLPAAPAAQPALPPV